MGSSDGTIRLWDYAKGTSVGTPSQVQDGVFSLAVSPSGSQIATGSDSGNVYVWGLTDSSAIRRFHRHPNSLDAHQTSHCNRDDN